MFYVAVGIGRELVRCGFFRGEFDKFKFHFDLTSPWNNEENKSVRNQVNRLLVLLRCTPQTHTSINIYLGGTKNEYRAILIQFITATILIMFNTPHSTPDHLVQFQLCIHSHQPHRTFPI